MEQTLELLQKQKQILTQKQIQSLTILAMDNVELDCFLRQEYLDNPMLEINGQSPETVYESLPVLPSEDDKKWNHQMEESKDLKEYLRSQLNIGNNDETYESLQKYLIECLDDSGYFTLSTKEVAGYFHTSEETVTNCLDELKLLEPVGVFSSDLKECLLRQLEALGSEDPLLKQMIKEHLEDVAHGNIGHISRSLKIPTSQVRKYLLMIGTLNPRPSTGFGIKKTEYIFLAVKSIAVILLITYVFYESFLPIFFMIPIWVIYARDGLRDLCRKKEKEFRVQFSNAIQAMGAALKAGYSVENAIREAEKDLAPMYEENVRIRKEFRKMVHQLDMKMPAVSVMEQFSERMKQEDTEDFVTVFSSAKMSGGDSISIIRNAVKIISGKIDTEQEIQTMFASKKLEFEIMCAVPFFIILYMKLTFGEFLSVLYENAAGRCFMTICLIVYIAAYSFGRKIIHIEV